MKRKRRSRNHVRTITYQGRRLTEVRNEWGLWRDTTRPDWYLIYCRPSGTGGPVRRQWVWTGGPDYSYADLCQAQRDVHSAVRAASENRPLPMSTADALAAHLENLRRANRSESHVRNVEICLTRFLRDTGLVKMADLTSHAVEKFLLGLRQPTEAGGGGASARSHNKYRSYLNSWCSWAVSRRFLATNPVVSISKAVEDLTLVEFPSLAEMLIIVQASTPYEASIWCFLAFSGLRQSSFLSLTPESFGPEGILIPRTKRRRQWMIRYDDGCPLWGPELGLLGELIWQQRPPTALRIRQRREAIGRKIGRPFKLHSLRHAFCSWLCQIGQHASDIQAWAHHTTARMTERYTHLRPHGADQIERHKRDLRTIRAQCLTHCLGEDYKALLDSRLREYMREGL